MEQQERHTDATTEADGCHSEQCRQKKTQEGEMVYGVKYRTELFGKSANQKQ